MYNSSAKKGSHSDFVRLAFVLGILLGFIIVPSGFSQAFRLGPFEVDAKARTEAVYTTNVEQERDADADAEQEDLYFILGLDLQAHASLMPRTEVTLDTGVSIERHLDRSDLDNSENPFGFVRFSSLTELGRSTLVHADAYYENTSESEDEQYVSPTRGVLGAEDVLVEEARTRKERSVHDAYGYSVGADWAWKALSLAAEYAFTGERYEDEAYEDGDEDVNTITFGSTYELTSFISLYYDYAKEKTETLNIDDDWEGWEETLAVGLAFALLQDPSLVYAIAYEKEDEQDEEGEWDITHSLDLNGTAFESRRLVLSYALSYSYEDVPEDDDIAFTYTVDLSHDITDDINQSLSFTREPHDTLGSTEDTENTSFGYNLDISQLFVEGLELSFAASFEIDEPMGDEEEELETEETLILGTILSHTHELTRQINQRIAYTYDYEDSNLEDEILEEHRVTLTYEYTF